MAASPLPFPRTFFLVVDLPGDLYPLLLSHRLQISREVAEPFARDQQLSGVALPPGAKAWVYSASEVRAIDFGLLDGQGMMWTPSVAGDAITFEIDAPSGSFAIRYAAIIPVAPSATDCFTDATCYGENDFQGIGLARKAVAHIEFIRGFRTLMCTGTLINDRGDVDAYFLTANHCINTESEATSVEAAWDSRTTSCGKPTALSHGCQSSVVV